MSLLLPPQYEPRWSNCLFWGARMLHHNGGYILGRKGHNGVPFHVLWSPDHVDVYSYEPLRNLRWTPRNWKSDLLLFFRGHVVRGDEVPSLRAMYPEAEEMRQVLEERKYD